MKKASLASKYQRGEIWLILRTDSLVCKSPAYPSDWKKPDLSSTLILRYGDQLFIPCQNTQAHKVATETSLKNNTRIVLLTISIQPPRKETASSRTALPQISGSPPKSICFSATPLIGQAWHAWYAKFASATSDRYVQRPSNR